MPTSFDAVVAGAGLAGAATAYHLTQKGLRRVLIVEREVAPGTHASGRNASLAFQQLSDGVEARLAVEGRAFIAAPPPGFAAAPLLRACGSLLLAGAAGAARIARTAAEAAALGVASESLSRAEACRRVPLLAGSSFEEARWTPTDGVVDIAALLAGFLREAASAGAELRCGAALEAVEIAGDLVVAVRVSGSRIETGILVNAAGAWAGEVGRLAGVGTRTLAPRRRHMVRAASPVAVDPDWPFVWHDDIDVYFRPDRGHLLLSPCDATPHPARAPEVDAGAEAALRDKVGRAFPPLAAFRPLESWACLRTFTADERFLIGPDPDLPGLVWVAGLGGHGMTTSPAVGRLGALAALGEGGAELEPFLPARLSGVVGAPESNPHG